MLPGEVSKATLDAVPDHCVAYCLAHHEPHSRRGRRDDLAPGGGEVDDEGARTCPPSPANRGAKGVGVPQAMSRGQHGLRLACKRLAVRRPGSCDPYGDGRRGCCDPHGCASAGGIRAPCDDDGCSAGTYAYSRASLHGGSGAATPADRQCQLVKAFRLAPPTHGGIWLPWTCGTRRRRVTGQRYALAFRRVKPTVRGSAGTRFWPVDEALPRGRVPRYVQAHRGSPPPSDQPRSTGRVTPLTFSA